MERHFHEELRQLKNKLLEMSFKVEGVVAKSCEALFARDEKLALEVIQEEASINYLEIEIDEKGHSFFALSQPMALDLRLAMMILKINTDLERMADHAVNIAEKTLFLLKEPPVPLGDHLEKMAEMVQKMLREALDSFLREDTELALSVLKKDDEVDDGNSNFYYFISELMEREPAAVNAGINLLMISHNLERIADLANNVAEDVIYLKQGREVKHRIHLRENTRVEASTSGPSDA